MNVKSEWAKFKAWIFDFLLRFWINTEAMVGKGSTSSTGKIVDWIGLVIALIFGVYLTPIIVDAVVETNFSNWNFTGASGAKTIYLFLPFIFIIGMIVYFIARLLGKV